MEHVQKTVIGPRLRSGDSSSADDGRQAAFGRAIRPSGRPQADGCRGGIPDHERSGLAMREQGMGDPPKRGRRSSRGRVAAGDGDSAGTPGVSCPQMGSVQEKRPLRRLVIANQKGGVGKTALAVHLSWMFQDQGSDVCFMDLDVQGNGSHTLSGWTSGLTSSAMFDGGLESVSAVPRPALIESDPKLADLDGRQLEDLAPGLDRSLQMLDGLGFDLCVIDTAPSLGVGLACALLAADYVICPLCLEYYSLQGLERMVATIRNVKTINPRLQFLGLVPSLVDRRDPRQRQHLDELVAAYPDLVSPPIGRRSSVAEGLALGLPVWRIDKRAAKEAAKEFRAVGAWVAARMDGGISDER